MSGGSDAASATKWPVVIGVLGLVVTLSGGALTWHASWRATQQIAAENCIQRVDKQEMLIREKAEILLGSIAKFGSKSADPALTESQFHEGGQQLVDNAMRFTAYAPIELTGVAMTLAGTIQVGLMADTAAQKDEAIKLASVAMKGWTSAYYSLMDKYESRRTDCLR